MTNRKICAIDTETTDVDLLKAEAVELAIVPLTDQFDVDERYKPLELIINPGEEALNNGSEALAFNKIGRDHIIKDGVPKENVLGFIQGWMFSHDIDIMVPLAHNWVFDRIVMCRLIGSHSTEKLIYRRAKDSHSFAVSINDAYKFNGLAEPFSQTRLTALADYFNINSDGAHRAINDCIMTAKIYRELLKFPMPNGVQK